MKIEKLYFAAFLLCLLAAASLQAQTETGMTNAVTNVITRVTPDNSPVIQSPSTHTDGMRHHDEDNFTKYLALMIPIIAIIMGCSIPIVIVSLQLYFRHRKNKMLHETVRAMVDKGVPIPPEMFKKTEHEFMEHAGIKRPRNDLRSGLVLTGLGTGLVLFIGKPGWIVLFLGIAFLVIGFLKIGKEDNK